MLSIPYHALDIVCIEVVSLAPQCGGKNLSALFTAYPPVAKIVLTQ